jgi:hypothetical protein
MRPSGEGGIAALRGGDPRVGASDQMNIRSLVRAFIFVFRIRIERARPSAPNKNARQSRDIHLICGEGGICIAHAISLGSIF